MIIYFLGLAWTLSRSLLLLRVEVKHFVVPPRSPLGNGTDAGLRYNKSRAGECPAVPVGSCLGAQPLRWCLYISETRNGEHVIALGLHVVQVGSPFCAARCTAGPRPCEHGGACVGARRGGPGPRPGAPPRAIAPGQPRWDGIRLLGGTILFCTQRFVDM